MTKFKTYELAVAFYRECTGVKAKAYIRDQLERASLSIVLNVAEGAAKPSKAEKKRFYSIAYASNRECQAILNILGEKKIFEKADVLGAHLFQLMRSAAS